MGISFGRDGIFIRISGIGHIDLSSLLLRGREKDVFMSDYVFAMILSVKGETRERAKELLLKKLDASETGFVEFEQIPQ